MSKGIQSLRGIQPGDLYTTDGKDVWEVRHFAEQPTITLKNIRTEEERGGVVGSPLMADFIKLVPQESPVTLS